MLVVHHSSPTASVSLKQHADITLPKKVLFSGLSGAIATTCIYPIDLLKTKMMNSKVKLSPMTAIKTIIQADGIFGFYRGWPPNVLFVIPEKAIKLTMNDYLRATIKQYRPKHDLPLSMEMLAGAGAGFCQVIATNPMELLKIQGATMTDKIKSGELQAKIPYTTLIRQLGFSGMYTGVLSTLARDVPFSFIYFPAYSQCKTWLLRDTHSNLGVKALAAGAIAGTLAAAVTTPLDVVKTRVHANVKPERLPLNAWLVREIFAFRYHYRSIVVHEGYRALFKGIGPRCLIISPLFAITMTCYEMFQQKWG